MYSRIVLIIFIVCVSMRCFGQGYMCYEYVPSTSFRDEYGKKCGAGDLQRISGLCTVPLSCRLDRNERPVVWTMSFATSYGIMKNEKYAQESNPDRILNTSLTLMHLRPLSDRWSLLASLGCGVYAVPDEVRWQSVLANGAFIFAYHLRSNLSVGIGGGLTNSYGIPVIMPMCYLKWRTGGRYEFIIDIANSLKVQVATHVSSAVKLEMTAIEMDGMAAVMRMDGKYKIYSSAMLRSGLSSSLRLKGKISICAGIGGVWMRSAKVSDRNLKSFFKSLSEDSRECYFGVAPCVSVGFRYGM